MVFWKRPPPSVYVNQSALLSEPSMARKHQTTRPQNSTPLTNRDQVLTLLGAGKKLNKGVLTCIIGQISHHGHHESPR